MKLIKAISIILVLATLCPATLTAADAAQNKSVSTVEMKAPHEILIGAKDEYIVRMLGDRRVRIPINVPKLMEYHGELDFWTPRPKGYVKPERNEKTQIDGFMMHMRHPDFVIDLATQVKDSKTPELRARWQTIYVHAKIPGSSHPDYQRMINVDSNIAERTKKVKIKIHDSCFYKKEKPIYKLYYYSLVCPDIEKDKLRKGLYSLDIFILNSKKDSTIIECPKRNEYYSNCRMSYVIANETISLKIIFMKKYLHEWQQIKNNAIYVFDSFSQF